MDLTEHVDRDIHRNRGGNEAVGYGESESLPVCLLPGYSGWDRGKTGLH